MVGCPLKQMGWKAFLIDRDDEAVKWVVCGNEVRGLLPEDLSELKLLDDGTRSPSLESSKIIAALGGLWSRAADEICYSLLYARVPVFGH